MENNDNAEIATSEEILGERFKKLPKQLQDAITSVDLRKQLGDISEKHKLHLDQAAAVENEVALVMMGFEKTGSFVDNLVKQARVPHEMATAIAGDVNSQIFLPIRGALQELEKTESINEQQTPRPPLSNTAATQGTPMEMETAERERATTPLQRPAPALESASISTPTPIPQAPTMTPSPILSGSSASKARPTPPSHLPTQNPAVVNKTQSNFQSIAQPEIVRVAPETPPTQTKPATPPPYKNDPYREPIDTNDTNLPKNR